MTTEGSGCAAFACVFCACDIYCVCVCVRQCPSLGTELCRGCSPALRELTAGVGADSARLYRRLAFTACALVGGEGAQQCLFPVFPAPNLCLTPRDSPVPTG